MGRKKTKTQAERDSYLQDSCARASKALNDLMRQTQVAGSIEFIDEEASNDDAARVTDKQEIHIRD